MELSSIQASLWNISWSSGFILSARPSCLERVSAAPSACSWQIAVRKLPSIYFAARTVVIADFLFTSPAAVVQLLTGLWLLRLTGYSLSDGWVKWGLALYFFAGAFWLPVVWMQVEMRDMARAALEMERPLSQRYWRRDRWWTILGSLAFPALVIVFYLMVAKP